MAVRQLHKRLLMKNTLLTIALVGIACFACGQNVDLYLWGTANPATVQANTAGNNPALVGGATGGSGCTSGLHGTNFSLATTWASTFVDSSAVEFSIAPDAGFQLNIDSIFTDLRRSGAPNGGTKVRFAYKIGAGAWVDAGVDVAPGGTSCTNFTARNWNIPNFSTTATLYVRIVAFSATTTAASNTFRNIKLRGTVTVAGASYDVKKSSFFLIGSAIESINQFSHETFPLFGLRGRRDFLPCPKSGAV